MLVNGKSDSYWLLLFLHQQHSVLFLTYFSPFFSPYSSLLSLFFSSSYPHILLPPSYHNSHIFFISFCPLRIPLLFCFNQLSLPILFPFSFFLPFFSRFLIRILFSSHPLSLHFLSKFSLLLTLCPSHSFS